MSTASAATTHVSLPMEMAVVLPLVPVAVATSVVRAFLTWGMSMVVVTATASASASENSLIPLGIATLRIAKEATALTVAVMAVSFRPSGGACEKCLFRSTSSSSVGCR